MATVLIPWSKKGAGLGYSGHKHQKGEKELMIVENHGFVLGPIAVRPVNQHDSVILPAAFENLIAFTSRIGIDLRGSALTLDAGFDSDENRTFIQSAEMTPVIRPNPRNTKDPARIAQKQAAFDPVLYEQRYKVERTFAWQDTYRKVALSYDRLEAIRLGFRSLAYSMINLRGFLNGNHASP